jgi:hypothetical protein
VTLALEAANVESLDGKHVSTILAPGFADRGKVAAALHAALVKWQSGQAGRAHAVTNSRIQMYEKYKDDPMVRAPRSRGMDVAMLRELNDALWGATRDRPMLPDDIVALVFDRRVDEARAAYAKRFPKASAEVAQAAIDDAVAYFTPKTR